MKKVLLVVLMIVMVIGLILGGCAKPAPAPAPTPSPTPPPTPTPAKPIELMANISWPPPADYYTKGLLPWIEEVEKRTEGRVKIVPNCGSALVPLAQSYDAILNGTIDIAEAGHGEFPGRFPLNECLNFSKIGPICWESGRVYSELYKKFPEIQAEYSGVKVLFLWCMNPRTLMMAKRPARTLEDIKGLKIWAGGSASQAQAKALGVSPVFFPAPDIYGAMQKGVVDGTFMSADGLATFKLEEVVKYLTLDSFGYLSRFVVMNMEKWNSLSAKDQQIMGEVDEWAANYFNSIMPSISQAAIEHANKEFGLEIIYLSPEEAARWSALLAPLRDEYVAQLEAKRLPAMKITEEMDQLLEAYAK